MSTLELSQAVAQLPLVEQAEIMVEIKQRINETEAPPEWHGDILKERLKKIEAGEGQFTSLDELIEQGTFLKK